MQMESGLEETECNRQVKGTWLLDGTKCCNTACSIYGSFTCPRFSTSLRKASESQMQLLDVIGPDVFWPPGLLWRLFCHAFTVPS